MELYQGRVRLRNLLLWKLLEIFPVQPSLGNLLYQYMVQVISRDSFRSLHHFVIRKMLFTKKVVKPLHRLPRIVITDPSCQGSGSVLTMPSDTWFEFWVILSGRRLQLILVSPFQLTILYDFMKIAEYRKGYPSIIIHISDQ